MIETRNLTKRYGDVVAVDRLTLKVDRGDLFGFIGPNGAGKTTTLRMLATLLRPDGGEAHINGHSVRRRAAEVRRTIGYMPDVFGVYGDLLVAEYLEFFAAAYGITGPKRRRVVEDALALTDLAAARDRPVATLSRGVQQRLGVARVLLHDPEVLLLDEPASGLDPRARIEMRELLLELRAMGKTVLISSHILTDLEHLCNKIAIMQKGRLLFSGPLGEAAGRIQAQQFLVVRVAGEPEIAARKLAECPAVAEAYLRDDTVQVRLSTEAGDVSDVAEFLIHNGFRLRAFHERGADLEQAFLSMTEGEIS